MTRRPPVTIGVCPRADHARLIELFRALELAFPCRFDPMDAIASGSCEAAIVFVDGADMPPPTVGIRRLVVRRGMTAEAASLGQIAFTNSEQVAARLRGRRLEERHASAQGPLAAPNRAYVLATGKLGPIWTRLRTASHIEDEVALEPPDLADNASLRDELKPGRFMALLPFVEFLRQLTAPWDWRPPPLRATFVIDDPNLHWRSYGHIRYAELVKHAQRNGYHIVMAMVPLDARVTFGPAVRLFRDCRRHISLTLHGNDHVPNELSQPRTAYEADRLLAQSLRRARRFEQRTGLEISRVMVPPHESCSERTAHRLIYSGFEALSATRPYLWLGDWRTEPYGHPPSVGPLTGWQPADLVAGCFPVLLRRCYWDFDEIVLRSYLDLPLILYGHVNDLADGLQRLGDAAAVVHGQGDVRWLPLSTLLRSNFQVKQEGPRLSVRLFARRIQLPVPSETEEVDLLWPSAVEIPHTVRLLGDEAAVSVDGFSFGLSRRNEESPRMLDLTIEPTLSIDPESVRLPRPHVWPIVRRLAAESRDRLQPLFARD